MTYLCTKSAFFPLVGAALHCSHLFKAGIVNESALRPPKLAPGMSSSQRARPRSISFYYTVSMVRGSLAGQPLHTRRKGLASCLYATCSSDYLKKQLGDKYVPRNDCAVGNSRGGRFRKLPVQDTTFDPVAKLQIWIRWRTPLSPPIPYTVLH